MVNIDDPNHFTSAQQRDGKKRLISIFNESLEAFETAVCSRIRGERNYGTMLHHPSRYAFAYLETNIAEIALMRDLRSPQHDLVRLAFD